MRLISEELDKIETNVKTIKERDGQHDGADALGSTTAVPYSSSSGQRTRLSFQSESSGVQRGMKRTRSTGSDDPSIESTNPPQKKMRFATIPTIPSRSKSQELSGKLAADKEKSGEDDQYVSTNAKPKESLTCAERTTASGNVQKDSIASKDCNVALLIRIGCIKIRYRSFVAANFSRWIRQYNAGPSPKHKKFAWQMMQIMPVFKIVRTTDIPPNITIDFLYEIEKFLQHVSQIFGVAQRQRVRKDRRERNERSEIKFDGTHSMQQTYSEAPGNARVVSSGGSLGLQHNLMHATSSRTQRRGVVEPNSSEPSLHPHEAKESDVTQKDDIISELETIRVQYVQQIIHTPQRANHGI